MDCPSPQELVDFANKRLDSDSSTKIINHLSGCADCSRKVAEESPLAESDEETWGSNVVAARSEETWGSGMVPMLADPTDEALAEFGDEPTPTDALPTGMSIGRYVLLEQLGMGGLSVVYAAYDHKLDRKIALKLMLPGPGREDDEGQTRLLREAQALAALAHPNVIAVHDVGTFGEQVFIAEEFVPGGTLNEWQKAEERSWREVVDVYRAAAEGLAAAHDAGMIHRDFKPDNVLIGTDGRARVSDFGLARAVEVADEDEQGNLPSAVEIAKDSLSGSIGGKSSKGALAARLTQTGAMLGTPAYMSLEQLLGKKVDPRTDQFSFFVALYESLYGMRPFEGATLRELMSNVATAKILDPPADTPVPPWLHKIILKGLAPDPNDRWDSMATVIDELGNDPTIRQRRIATGAGGVAVLAVLAVVTFFIGRGAVNVCTDADKNLADVWDPAVKAKVQAAFAASDRPYGADTFTRVEKILDRYTTDWVTMHTEACEATHKDGKQSDILLDRRMACLDRRLNKLGALTTLFAAEPNGEIVDKAVEASSTLTTLDACADTDALLAKVPPPEDKKTRKRVAELRARLDEAEALERAGRFKEGLAICVEVFPGAADVGYVAIRAEAEFRKASLLQATGDFKAALGAFRNASTSAAEARDDELLAASLVEIVQVAGFDLKHGEALDHLWTTAGAAVVRAGEDPLQRATLLGYFGRAQSEAGKYRDAQPHLDEALRLRERHLGADHLAVAESRQFLGTNLRRLRRLDEAQVQLTKAHETRVSVLGATHVDVAESLLKLCEVRFAEVDLDEAMRLCRKALSVYRTALGEDHPRVGEAENGVGVLLIEQSQYVEAQAHLERSVKIFRSAFGSTHPDVARPLGNLSGNLFYLGEIEEAKRVGDEVLAIRAKSLGEDHPHFGVALYNQGFYLQEAGRYEDALEYHRRATATWKTLDDEHPFQAYALTGVGICEIGLGRPRAALPLLERALKIRETKPSDAVERARTRFALAQALNQVGQEKGRARELAISARKAFAASEDDAERKRADEVEKWLNQNGG